MYHLNTEERQRAHPKKLSKNSEIYQNLEFHHLKIVKKMIRQGIFPVFDKIFTANIFRMWGKREEFTTAEVLLPS